MKEKLQLYPNPLLVGDYIDKSVFDEMQNYSATDCGSWVHFNDQARNTLEGKYFEVKPLIAEFVTTHLCNFSCPTCSRRMLRETWLESESTWNSNATGSVPDTKHSINLDGMKKIVDKLASNDVKAIVWGGGEPTLNKNIYDGIVYAKKQGVYSSLITNGVNLNFHGMEKVLSYGLDLIRISLNCASIEKHAFFHGYPSSKNFYSKVINNIRMVAELVNSSKSKTNYGISVILDNKNIDEINSLVDLVFEIVHQYKKSPINFLVLRSVYNYYENYGELDDATYQTFQEIDLPKAFSKLYDCGVEIVIPKSDSLKKSSDCTLESKEWQCLGYGWLTEIHPSGDMFLCSDAYGNPEYIIGNLLEQEFDDIWLSDKRRSVLAQINKNDCVNNYCPFTGRGHHLNRIINQIESLRENDLNQVDEWVTLLRQFTSYKIPFYL